MRMEDYVMRMRITIFDEDRILKNKDGTIKEITTDYIIDKDIDNLISRFIDYINIWEDKHWKEFPTSIRIYKIMEELKRIDENYYNTIISIAIDGVEYHYNAKYDKEEVKTEGCVYCTGVVLNIYESDEICLTVFDIGTNGANFCPKCGRKLND